MVVMFSTVIVSPSVNYLVTRSPIELKTEMFVAMRQIMMMMNMRLVLILQDPSVNVRSSSCQSRELHKDGGGHIFAKC